MSDAVFEEIQTYAKYLNIDLYSSELARFADENTVYKIPAPGLVELIESGKGDSPETDALLRDLLAPYPELDALVLGCTHYPFVTRALKRVLGDGVKLLDGGEGTARQTRHRLEDAGLLREGQGEVIIENSADREDLLQLSWDLLVKHWGRPNE